MIKLDSDMLRRLQAVELELLMEADRICRMRGIRYNIIAGTMLGAARHGGFIPWDDDADIAMLRGDYDRFRQACREDLDPRYEFQDHVEAPGYRWGYGKLRRRDTLFLREHQEHMPYAQGVFIDVFPLDAVPDYYPARALKNFECFIVRKFLWAEVGRRADRSLLKRRLYAAMAKVPLPRILRYYEGMIRRAGRLTGRGAGGRTRMVRILLFPTPGRDYGYPRKHYEGEEPAVFEGAVLQGVADPEGYLAFKFGDWRTPPPPEGRKVHPVSAISLPAWEDIPVPDGFVRAPQDREAE